MDQIRQKRERIARLGVACAFLLADQLKPDNVARHGKTFSEVLSWKNHELKRWLDKFSIMDKDRRSRYDTHSFVLMLLPLSEIRLWPGAGGLPKDWTDEKSVSDLARWLKSSDAPALSPQFERFHKMRDFVENGNSSAALELLSVIPAIALPEFHTAGRQELPDVPWTLDDGCHRALILAMYGREHHLWCMVGVPHSSHSIEVPDALLERMAGHDPNDREAIAEYLRGSDGQRLLRTGASPELLDRLALGKLPSLPLRPDYTLSGLRDRVALRLRVTKRARQAGLFRATDDRGHIVASSVATGEFIRTHGPGAFLQPGQGTDEKQPDHNEALREAGRLGQDALELVGISPRATSDQSTRTQSALLALVHRLAEGALAESDSGLVLAVAASGAANSVLELARTQQGADLWLRRQIARAATVAADGAEVDADWPAVQRYTALGIAALLNRGHLPTALPDVLALVRLLNRLGVSYRARWQDGWVQQAAPHHEAAIVLLRGRRPPNRKNHEHQLLQDYMLNCFTTLTNLASAWTETVYAGGAAVDDTDLRRAWALLRGQITKEDDLTLTQRQFLAHKALHYDRSPACRNSEECLPSEMLRWTFAGNTNYKPWRTGALANDLAEINWRIAMHEIAGRPKSTWTADAKPRDMLNYLKSAVDIHTNAIKTMIKTIAGSIKTTADNSETFLVNSEVAVTQFWLWRHRKNLRDKVDALQERGRNDLVDKLLKPEYLQELDTALKTSKPVQQLGTLDAYHSTQHQIVLLDDANDGRLYCQVCGTPCSR